MDEGGKRRRVELSRSELAARIHDVSSGVAVGIGLLGAEPESAKGVFERLLGDLRRLQEEIRGDRPGQDGLDAATSLREEAHRIGVTLELRVVGNTSWLTSAEISLIRLAGQEALRNVRRLAGSARCRMTIDASGCPFVLRVRDWGAGIPIDARAGAGLRGLRQLAEESGCQVSIGSLPGLGTELVLVGRHCQRQRSLERLAPT